MNEINETISDIVEGKRRVAQHIRENNDTILGIYEALKLEEEADRIEAAHKREIADEKRISDAVIQSLRDKKLEMAGEIAAKEAEVSTLRALVEELADKLECCSSMYHDLNMFHAHEELDAIVASARRVIMKDKQC